jgi:hypothetical protein
VSKRNKQESPAAPQQEVPPTPYEQGVFDCLQMLREEVQRMSDANRTAVRLTWEAPPEVQSLLNFANPAINIVGDVQNRVEKRALRHLNERRAAQKETT